MLSTEIKDLILSFLPSLKHTPSGWYKCNCPVCEYRGESEDKRERFGIKFQDETIGMNCFNCKFQCRWENGSLISKNLMWFLERIGVPDSVLSELRFTSHKEREIYQSVILPETTFATKRKWVQKALPEGSLTLAEWASEGCDDPDFINVLQYTFDRKIDNFNDFYWSPSKNFQMNKRLIIPYKYKNIIVGYTGRYYNNTHAKQIPKYMSDMPENFVYNLDAQTSDREFVILCEGVLDAYLTSGIACLGNSINQKQIDIINSLRKNVILCADRDAAGEHIIQVAVENGWAVSFPKWAEDVKDAAQSVQRYGKILTVRSILESTASNPLKVYVSRKLDTFIP
jgi:hypothetical protein